MNIKHGMAGLALAVVAMYAHAAGFYITSYLNGNNYERLSPDARLIYVAGAIDGMVAGAINGGGTRWGEQLGRCVTNMQNAQLMAIIDKYLADNPANWDMQMNLLITNAMLAACTQRGFPLPGPRP